MSKARQIDALVELHATPEAERARRHRQRRAMGLDCVVTVGLNRRAAIDRLRRAGKIEGDGISDDELAAVIEQLLDDVIVTS